MADKKKIKVLVVDDEPSIVEILKYNLQKEGYDVATAEDGLKAVKVAAKFIPDVILLDIMMPQQDGVETCLQLRQLPEVKNAFIIFLTARMEEYSEVAAFDVKNRKRVISRFEICILTEAAIPSSKGIKPLPFQKKNLNCYIFWPIIPMWYTIGTNCSTIFGELTYLS
jgi:CheY-like chemotaxis protein